jgi:hypothetical protein
MTMHMTGTREGRLGAAARGAADWLCLAAAPSFAIMALLAAAPGGSSHEILCQAPPDASPLGGMAAMYALMSAFHSAPWLRLFSSRRSGPRLIRRNLTSRNWNGCDVLVDRLD